MSSYGHNKLTNNKECGLFYILRLSKKTIVWCMQTLQSTRNVSYAFNNVLLVIVKEGLGGF